MGLMNRIIQDEQKRHSLLQRAAEERRRKAEPDQSVASDTEKKKPSTFSSSRPVRRSSAPTWQYGRSSPLRSRAPAASFRPFTFSTYS